MKLVRTRAELAQAAGVPARCVFVPTMGNLHAGHLNLVRQARAFGDRVVVSIFVNRLQFAPHEDFDSYPRTLERDLELLKDAGCDLVFAPPERELYSAPQIYHVQPPPALAGILEGEFRPGFFEGVCTIVMKLFQCVQPSVAVFGKKDYQQLMVIRGMVEQLCMPIEVVAGETERADDGLALSSRNGYLSTAERSEAAALQQTLQRVVAAVRSGERDLQRLETEAMQALRERGWVPDYVTVRRRGDLLPPGETGLSGGTPLVALAAARLGTTRLIDNREV